MRPIDADELIKALNEALKEQTARDSLTKQLLVGFAKQVLSDAPTVEAIPLEWIRKWRRQHSAIIAGYISCMLLDWEKENETN